jgi:anthranilate phosphoribosyltransferase
VASGLIAAGAGVRVLIVSDRCVPPKRGLTAASVLERLGLDMTWDPAEAEDWVAKTRFAVVSASGMLPGLMGLRRVRGEIGVRTPLSTVEKLIAPPSSAIVIGAQQGPVLGVGGRSAAGARPQARDRDPGSGRRRGARDGQEDARNRAVRRLPGAGNDRAGGPRHGMRVGARAADVRAADEGYGSGDNQVLVQSCGDMTSAVLAGENGPARNAALLGASVILKAAGRTHTFAEGVSLATESLDGGAPRRILEALEVALVNVA